MLVAGIGLLSSFKPASAVFIRSRNYSLKKKKKKEEGGGEKNGNHNYSAQLTHLPLTRWISRVHASDNNYRGKMILVPHRPGLPDTTRKQTGAARTPETLREGEGKRGGGGASEREGGREREQ